MSLGRMWNLIGPGYSSSARTHICVSTKILYQLFYYQIKIKIDNESKMGIKTVVQNKIGIEIKVESKIRIKF